MHQVLQPCKGDFSRKSIIGIIASSNNLKNVARPILLPGITVNTSPTDHCPLVQLQRWTGRQWERFGNIIEGAKL